MCRGNLKWKKNRQGLRNELPVDRENVGLRNGLEPFWAWKCGAPERSWSVLSVKMPVSGTARARLAGVLGQAANPRRWRTICIRAEPGRGTGRNYRLKLKKFWKWWSPERQKSAKNVSWWCSGTDFFGGVIFENDMLRNGNSGMKMGVSRAAQTKYAYIMEVPPPPPRAVYASLCLSIVKLRATVL